MKEEKSIAPKKDKKERDADMVGAEKAMQRAAEVARRQAKSLGMGIVVWKDGRVVEEK